ncbi:MAG: hypothetical protein ACLFQP_00590 [Halothece sp.]
METITFSGIEGQVIKTSPHGNYVVVKLSDRITICGTFTNQFKWEKHWEKRSGFVSFITYIGLTSPEEAEHFINWVLDNGGHFKYDEDTPRESKWVKEFPFEIKVRGLSAKSVTKLVKEQ